MCRYSPFFQDRAIERVVLPIGVATMILAGVRALLETDIKKVVALSTLSQLGLIIRALGAHLPSVAFFHLLTHAYFKALLFIAIGNLIHLSRGYQDSRKIALGGALIGPSLAFSLMANFRLIGLPFLAGFFSKDLIIEARVAGCFPLGVLFAFYFATALTAAYTIRVILSIIRGLPRSSRVLWREDSSFELPLANNALFPLAVVGGALVSWLLFSTPNMNVIPDFLKNFTTLAILGGSLLGGLWATQSTKRARGLIKWGWGIIWSLPFRSTPILAKVTTGLRARARKADLT